MAGTWRGALRSEIEREWKDRELLFRWVTVSLQGVNVGETVDLMVPWT